MNRILFLFFLSLLTIVACQKENIDETTVQVIPTGPVVTIITNGDVTGKVIDESGAAIGDALVTLGDKETYTNEYGLFLFENATLSSQGTYVKVDKAGYFHGSRTFIPASSARQNVVVQLLEKTEIGAYQSTETATLTVESGTTIRFQADGIIDANGNSYTGEVRVIAKRLDPLAPNLADIMPGNLTGVDENGQRVALATYGMLAVELESPTGEALQLAPEKPATIRYQIPTALRANAPESIPLWYFDEVEGTWLEEGSAYLNNNAYVGEVAHFSFWNCDDPFNEFITLNGTVVNKSLEGIEGLTVQLQIINGGSVGYAQTDVEGNFSGLVPTDETFTITVTYIDECGETHTLYEGEIGPFNEDADLPQIIVDLGLIPGIEATFQVTGTLVDCDGNSVWGLVNIENENGDYLQSVVTDSDGTFDAVVISCYPVNEVFATMFSFITFQEVTINQPISETVNFGETILCGGIPSSSFVFIYDDEGVMIEEGSSDYRDVQIEYSDCASMYYFEISCANGNLLTGISCESTEPIVSGAELIGFLIWDHLNPQEIIVTIVTLNNELVQGTYTANGITGSFSAPLN